MTNLQGSFNTVIRKENKLYQVKSNKPTYLRVEETGGTYIQGGKTYKKYRAFINYGNAVIKPLGAGGDCSVIPNCSVGNSIVSMIIEDNGEPNASIGATVDRIGFTVKDETNTIYYATNDYVSGTASTYRYMPSILNDLLAGNLQVHVGNAFSTTGAISQAVSNTQEVLPTSTELGLKVLPNPSSSRFILQLTGNSASAVSLRITDLLGRVVESRTGLQAGQSVQVGASYRPGVYIAEITQGTTVRQIKLIKID
jgi:hypothetical protein